jgi:hypothetical protein
LAAGWEDELQRAKANTRTPIKGASSVVQGRVVGGYDSGRRKRADLQHYLFFFFFLPSFLSSFLPYSEQTHNESLV